MDYKTAGGDVATLKALDHHSNLDPDNPEMVKVFDVCRAGVVTQELQTSMQTTKPHTKKRR